MPNSLQSAPRSTLGTRYTRGTIRSGTAADRLDCSDQVPSPGSTVNRCRTDARWGTAPGSRTESSPIHGSSAGRWSASSPAASDRPLS